MFCFSFQILLVKLFSLTAWGEKQRWSPFSNQSVITNNVLSRIPASRKFTYRELSRKKKGGGYHILETDLCKGCLFWMSALGFILQQETACLVLVFPKASGLSFVYRGS